MMHTVSQFRSAMARHGHTISFSEAAQILVDAGIVKRTNDGYILSNEIVNEVRRLNGE